jgi:hypothetical protein
MQVLLAKVAKTIHKASLATVNTTDTAFWYGME